MSFRKETEFEGQHIEGYPLSFPINVLSEPWTPPASVSSEVRRDSVASTQASLSSTTSRMSDYTGPLTPVTDDSYMDGMPYFHQSRLSTNALSGPRFESDGQAIYDSWQFVTPTHTEEFVPTYVSPQTFVSKEDNLYPLHDILEHTSLATDISPCNNSSWGVNPMSSQPDSASIWGIHGCEPVVPTHDFQGMFDPQGHTEVNLSIVTSGLGHDYNRIESPELAVQTPSTLDHLSFSPEPFFKKEPSPIFRQESATESYYVGPTGGKVPKKTRRAVKSKKQATVTTAKVIPKPRHPCPVLNCGRTFARTEHRKRHIDSHKDERPYGCMIENCPKRFGRRDNYKDHYFTHVIKPGADRGRNSRLPIEEIEQIVRFHDVNGDSDKIIQSIRTKYERAMEKLDL